MLFLYFLSPITIHCMITIRLSIITHSTRISEKETILLKLYPMDLRNPKSDRYTIRNEIRITMDDLIPRKKKIMMSTNNPVSRKFSMKRL